MSDLHRAVEAEIEAFRPDLTPSFSALRNRHRTRSHRRKSLAVATSVLAAVLVTPVVWSSAMGGGDSLLQQADPGRTGYQAVQIFLSTEENCGDVRPVERQVPANEAVVTAALQELFSGRLTDEERAQGLSGFAPETAGLLRSLRVDNGTAYVDLDASMTDVISFASTSCGGSAFQAMIARTLEQFPTVTDVRYAFDGDPRAFAEFSQQGCPDPPVPAGDPCDPRPWRSTGKG